MEARIIKHPRWNAFKCEIFYSSFWRVMKFEKDFNNPFEFCLDTYNNTGCKYEILEPKKNLSDYHLYFHKLTPESYIRQLQLKGDLPNILTYLIYDVEHDNLNNNEHATTSDAGTNGSTSI